MQAGANRAGARRVSGATRSSEQKRNCNKLYRESLTTLSDRSSLPESSGNCQQRTPFSRTDRQRLVQKFQRQPPS